MPRKIYIFGHQNPDTDTICSAIAYANYKKQQGYQNVQPYRLGKINRETEFVLNYFDVKTPELLTDIKPTLKDMDLYTPVTLERDRPVKTAWDYLKSYPRSRIIPITDQKGKIEGILSLSDITKLYMEATDEDFLAKYEILYENLLAILDINKTYGEYPFEKLQGNIHIGSSISDPDILTKRDIIITTSMDMARKYAASGKCGCLMITNGQSIEEFMDCGCAIVGINNTLFKTISLINQAISVGSLMHKEDIISFSEDAEVDDVIHIVQMAPHRNFPVVDRKGAIVGIMSRRHLIEYKKKKVILVDHNEKSQSVEGLDQAEIVEIIDHHRVADVQTAAPLYIRAEPVGSTATIIYKMYRESKFNISKSLGGLLLSAILSDTLMFRSPTSTEDDRKAAQALSAVAEVHMEEYGREMFAYATSLQDYTPEEILAIDRKQFNFGKYTAYISQVNTLDFRSIVNMAGELLIAMEDFVHQKNGDLVILMITDIVEGGSELLVKGRARDLTYRAFGLDYHDDAVFLPGVVSRKKQIVPQLTIAVQS